MYTLQRCLLFLQILVSELLSREWAEILSFSQHLYYFYLSFKLKTVKIPIQEKLSVSALLVSLTSNPSFKINQSLFSLQYILMLDICKAPPCISVCKSLHDLNHYNLHIPYPLWLALTTSVCLLDYLLHLCFSLHFVLCKASGVKSLLQDNTADKTSRYHQSAVIEAGFISRFILGLLYLCFYNFTYLYAFYCCREIDYLLGNACHQRHDIDKISFELDGLKNNNISEKTAEISTFNSKPNIPYRHNILNIP